ncbi:hypothetical protein R3P38DRAFT_2611488 [Favolaschia claudopus]|uniref:F-box domain-containing protein n=1 Tax=Favolaschia claudopus TaxID=2862362 RepID=A0AAW0CUG3_9AGAR
MLSYLNSWLAPPSSENTLPSSSRFHILDIPNEIWTYIFEDPSLGTEDLFHVFTACHHFNDLVLPVLVCGFTMTDPPALVAGHLEIPSTMVSVLELAFHSRFPVRELTITFDIRNGRGGTQRELSSLTTLVNRYPSLVDLNLRFLGDLMAPSNKSADLAPQRPVTEAFCGLLSSFSYDPHDPMVLVDTEIFTCRAADVQKWQLDKYRFAEPDAGGGLYNLLSAGMQTLVMVKQPNKYPHRTKTPVRLHNDLQTSVFPFISISSVHMQRMQTPSSFTDEYPSWTLAVFNQALWHWPNSVNMSCPLAAEEWSAILPLVNFENLPQVRMDPPSRPDMTSKIPAPVLDAFLHRHPTITRMYYYPDPLTVPSGPPFPFASLPRIRNISTTSRNVVHLFQNPAAFPNLGVLTITGTTDAGVMTDALRLLARHAGKNKLIMEIHSGSWMDCLTEDMEAVVRSVYRVDTVLLSAYTDWVEPLAILRWLSLFPALRRIGLQNCIHSDAGQKEQEDFPRRAREVLPESVEVIAT